MRGLPRRPIGDILISMGAISVEQLEEALLEQKQTHRKLGELLSAVGIVTEVQRKIFIKVDFEAAPELESKATP